MAKDRGRALAFYNFPAEHRAHLRTTNPIESTFATVLLRTARESRLSVTQDDADDRSSSCDLAFTRRIAEAGELLGIRLVDHIILGDARRWVSLRQRGVW